MKKIVECVPNFSEGRRKEAVDALAAALTAHGAALLDSEMDAAHNRCVISVAGEPGPVAAGVVTAVGRALELIDLRHHEGEHPRMGAADVIPFVPVSGITIEECVELSVSVGKELADRYRLPVYLYEQSARVPARQDLAYVRKGGFEGIRAEIGTDPARAPDFGPAEVHASGGATAVGARFPLIAYNVYLNTTDLRIATEIARAVRFSSGGLRYVKALGFEIKQRNQVQVSMNLTNYEGTPIFRALDLVTREAERYGVAVASSEIVGLVPQGALDRCADFYLKLENFSPGQVLENRLKEALAARDTDLEEFLARVAAPEPAPGGGSVAAVGGALAAALGEMVAGLTEGRKKYEQVHARVQELHAKLAEARRDLQELVREDAAAYEGVISAFRLPKETDEQKSKRNSAIQLATRQAIETPLRTARVAAEVLEALDILVQIGNSNAKSDAAAGAQLAFAAVKSAQYNVLINLPALHDSAFAEQSRAEANQLASSARRILERIDAVMTS